jgi:hypothetical protein
MYGEHFSQRSLGHFRYYDPPGEHSETVVRNKRLMLRRIARLNRDRAAGGTLGSGDASALSGVRMKAGILLGIENDAIWMTDALRKRRITFVKDDAFEDERRIASTFHPVDIDEESLEKEAVLVQMPWRSLERTRKSMLKKMAGSFVFPHRIGQRLFREGVFLDRYHILPKPKGMGCRLLLRVGGRSADGHDEPQPRSTFWQVNEFENGEDAAIFGNALRGTFVLLNRRCEGFHVVEHLLLRKREEKREDVVSPDFYSFRVSIVLPSWTTRFFDDRFRALTEETVAQTIPAHVRPTYVWLDFDEMLAFENTYRKWIRLNAARSSEYETLDILSGSVKTFLSKKHRAAEEQAFKG